MHRGSCVCAWHRSCFPLTQHRETEAQSQAGLEGARAALGCLRGAHSPLGLCRARGNPQVLQRPVCQHTYPYTWEPRGTPLPPPAWHSDGAKDLQHPEQGEVDFASGVQAEGRSSEECRCPPACKECRESWGKHPHATSPSAQPARIGT